MAKPKNKYRRRAGIGVDTFGGPIVDPTANVTALNVASNKRQDDLREMESAHVRELMAMRAIFNEELRKAESARIDAIRAVDVAAVQRAAEVAAEAVQTLAAQVPITAEAVRTSLAAALNPILNDIAELRKVQYEQQGQRAAVSETRTGTMQSWQVAAVVTAIVFGVIGVLLTVGSMVFVALHG